MTIEQLRQISTDFSSELEKAAAGHKSSLYWLVLQLNGQERVSPAVTPTSPTSPVTGSPIIPAPELPLPLFSPRKVFALSIGGSNAQLAWLEKSAATIGSQGNVAGNYKIVGEVISISLPIFTSGDQLIDFMAALIPSEADYIGINFAYGTEQIDFEGLPDASLVAAKNKEHDFEGLVDKSLVQSLRSKLANKRAKIGIVNDTVCLSMAARAVALAADSSPIVCGVLGTGVNFSISPRKGVYVNSEACLFDKFEMTPSLSYVDSISSEKGDCQLEKATAGKYLYQHYNYLVAAASEQLSAKTQVYSTRQITSTQQLSELAATGDQLAQQVMADSASLLAAVICGLADYLEQTQLTIPMEGSLFWQGHNYQSLVIKTISAISEDRLDIRFIEIPHSNLLGLGSIYA